jgi:hypothetical protein
MLAATSPSNLTPGQVACNWVKTPRFRILWDADNVNYTFETWEEIASALAPAQAASIDVFAHSGVAAELVCPGNAHKRPSGAFGCAMDIEEIHLMNVCSKTCTCDRGVPHLHYGVVMSFDAREELCAS